MECDPPEHNENVRREQEKQDDEKLHGRSDGMSEEYDISANRQTCVQENTIRISHKIYEGR